MLFKGMLFSLPGQRGVAKLESIEGDQCCVSIFHSATRSDTQIFPLRDLERAYLSPQTRVYICKDDVVRVGRVTDYLAVGNGLVDYEVRFPNGRQGDFSERDLFVRPWNVPEDPAEILAFGGSESQYLHDRRRSAIEPLRDLRSASQGLTALMSAGIDFVPHQIAAVRRVLTDPIQRYLLADEVGLGKTIEAGLIIRQHLIDNPDTTVLISTPAHLCDQWRGELSGKLMLDQFEAPFEVCTHLDLARVSRSPDILVVDEAHHLVGVESGPMREASERLVDLAHRSPVLLLLSATPTLGREQEFLALLNLLDPATHRLDDIEGFRLKLERRRELGRLLLSLSPESPGLVLRQRAAELERLFPEDAEVGRIAPRLIAATRDASEEIAGLALSLKQHVADTYRIHQRLIRSRRADAQGWEFMPRGPAVSDEPDLSHVKTESDPDSALVSVLGAVEAWRFAAAEAPPGTNGGLASRAGQYRRLLELVGQTPGEAVADVSRIHADFEGGQEAIESLIGGLAEASAAPRLGTMVESTLRLLKTLKLTVSHPKIVVFATSPSIADAFQSALRSEAPDLLVFHVQAADPTGEKAQTFAALKSAGVLVTDQSGEEGLNLANADAIVHLDLPMSAARLEQRIGRLDRFGRKQGVIRHRILLPHDEETSPWQAWLDFLADGLHIFNRSISDVQFLLEDIENEAIQRLLLGGPPALAAFSQEVRTRIAEERASQHEQYALDRLALLEQPVEAFIQAMELAEEDEGALEQGVDDWVVGGLLLKKRPVNWPEADPFRITATPQTLIPRRPWLSSFLSDNITAMTWRRRVATRRNDVELLRPGTPFVDVLERFTRWDDRGTAFMTWRTLSTWKDEPWLGFRLCLVVEPDLPIADLLAPSRSELALARRAQQYFQSRSATVYVDINGQPVTDQPLLDILELPYRKAGEAEGYADVNLGSRQRLLDGLIDPGAFQQICREVGGRTREALAAESSFRAAVEAATLAAGADLERRRIRRASKPTPDAFEDFDSGMIEAILTGLKTPMVRLDAMGLYVIAGTRPSAMSHA